MRPDAKNVISIAVRGKPGRRAAARSRKAGGKFMQWLI